MIQFRKLQPNKTITKDPPVSALIVVFALISIKEIVDFLYIPIAQFIFINPYVLLGITALGALGGLASFFSFEAGVDTIATILSTFFALFTPSIILSTIILGFFVVLFSIRPLGRYRIALIVALPIIFVFESIFFIIDFPLLWSAYLALVWYSYNT